MAQFDKYIKFVIIEFITIPLPLKFGEIQENRPLLGNKRVFATLSGPLNFNLCFGEKSDF